MAQNITLLGASYSDVPAVVLPKTGGGTARFDDASVTTATASDVASGKIFLANDGTITTGTASGGGGASNVVTGTFKGTTTGAAMDVTLNYSGSGYPVVVVICPTEGTYNSTIGTFYNLIQMYASDYFVAIKTIMNATPSYQTISSAENGCSIYSRYKNSPSNATNYSGTAQQNYNFYTGTDASGSAAYYIVRFKTNTKMSVFIASTQYGFAQNIEYTYRVIYSS